MQPPHPKFIFYLSFPSILFCTQGYDLLPPAWTLTGDSDHTPAFSLPSSCHFPTRLLLPHRLCFLLLLPHMTNSASLSGFTVSTFLPPSALYENQSCLILLWSHTLQRIWCCSPECRCAHDHVAPTIPALQPSPPQPGVPLQAPPRPSPAVPPRPPQPFLFLIPSPNSWLILGRLRKRKNGEQSRAEQSASPKQQKLLCVHTGAVFEFYTVLQTLKGVLFCNPQISRTDRCLEINESNLLILLGRCEEREAERRKHLLRAWHLFGIHSLRPHSQWVQSWDHRVLKWEFSSHMFLPVMYPFISHIGKGLTFNIQS